MLIRLKNPQNNRTLMFASSTEFRYFFGENGYLECNINDFALLNDAYIIRSSPTGFFDTLQNNPSTVKGSNQDGSDYISDYKSERILTWTFNNVLAVGENKTTNDFFASVMNIKNMLIEMTVFWFNPASEEIIESFASVYRTNNSSFEAGQVQVIMDGNGLFETGIINYPFNLFSGGLPYIPAESKVFSEDLTKIQFGSKSINDTLFINDITASSPIIVNVNGGVTNFEITNVTTGISSKILGNYSTIIINSQKRTVVADGNNEITNLVGGFIYLIEGTNKLVITDVGSFPTNVTVDVDVIQYADSISG